MAKTLSLVASPAREAATRVPLQRSLRLVQGSSKENKAKVIRLCSLQLQDEEMAKKEKTPDEEAMLRVYREDQISLLNKYSELKKLVYSLEKRLDALEKGPKENK